MRYFLKPLLLLSLLIPTFSFAQGTKNTLSGPSATVQTDGTDSVGAVNIGTQNAGRINFFINNTLRGYFDGTTGALTGVSVTGLTGLSLANNVWLTASNALGNASINVLRVTSSDDLEIASDAGDTILISPAGTVDLTITAAQTAISSSNYQIVPGTSSYTIRNNADDTNNFLFNNDGSLGLGGTNKRLYSSAGLIFGVDADAQRIFTLDASSDSDFTLTFGDGGTTATPNLTIKPGTPDGDDDGYVCIASGFACSRNSGSFIITKGNELASVGGDLEFSTGVGAGDTMYFYQAANVEMTLDASALTLATNSLILSGASSSVRQPIVNGITAAGTTTSDATALTGVINYVTTVASGTGVKLWEAGVGSVIYVHNLGANALLVYPPTGGQIYGTAVDAGPSVASGSHAVCTKRAAGGGDSWVCFEAGNI